MNSTLKLDMAKYTAMSVCPDPVEVDQILVLCTLILMRLGYDIHKVKLEFGNKTVGYALVPASRIFYWCSNGDSCRQPVPANSRQQTTSCPS